MLLGSKDEVQNPSKTRSEKRTQRNAELFASSEYYQVLRMKYKALAKQKVKKELKEMQNCSAGSTESVKPTA